MSPLYLVAAFVIVAAALAVAAAAIVRARGRSAQLQLELARAMTEAELRRAEVDRERQLAQDQAAQAAASSEQMLAQFKAASSDVMRDNREAFLQLAKAELEQTRIKSAGDLEARTKQVDELVKPIGTTLKEVDQRLQQLSKERAKTEVAFDERMRALTEASTALGKNATDLTEALRRPAGRGQWGELQLRRVVETAGLSEQCRDFTTQATTLTDDERRLRPDMVVQLPNRRCVIIDSKVPIDAYLTGCEEDDDAIALGHFKRHGEQVRTHVRQLAGKQYDRHVDGALADLVILFLPAEHLFAAALEHHPGLIEEAYGMGVVLASPTSLLTMLHAVAQGWREERIAQNAEEIAALGRQLHERIATLADHFAAVGKRLDSTTKAYNQAVGTLEGRVLVTARKFQALDAGGKEPIVELAAGASEAPRQVAARELLSRLNAVEDVA